MAAPNVRVTITSWVPFLLEQSHTGKGNAAARRPANSLARIHLASACRRTVGAAA
jgi:hypothetical protein